jgi:HlyD family secretion protein
MSSSVSRIELLCGASFLFAMVIASAQDRKVGEPAEHDRAEVFISVEGRTVVLTSLPEGSRVETGGVICELDPSDIKDRLVAQEIIVRGAEADVHASRIAREAAVMAVNEYQEGTFRQELAVTEGEIKLAESKLASAEDHLAWCQRMFAMGYCSMSEKISDELALKHARFALEAGQSQKKVLLDYTRARKIKVLTGAVEAARAGELAKQAVLERERSVRRRLTDQVGRCKVLAPSRGRITYAVPIGTGAIVHDGQLLGRIYADAASANNRAK